MLENLDFEKIWTIVSSVVTVAAAVAAVTASPRDDGWAATTRKLLDFLALNVGHARNAKR